MRYKDVYLFILLLINSQFIFPNAGNPLAIRGLQEGFLILLLIYAIVYLISSQLKKGGIRKEDAVIFSIVIFLIFVSVFFSYVKFQQPILYGLIEARRCLALLIYFPLRKLADSSGEKNFPQKIIFYIVLISSIMFFIALLMKLGLFGQDLFTASDPNSIRADRNGIGKYYFVLSYLVTLVLLMAKPSWKLAFIAFMFAFGIFFFTQERQKMLAVAILTILYFIYSLVSRGKFKSVVIGLMAILALVGFSIFFMQEKVIELLYLSQEIFSEDVFDSARASTISIIYEQLVEWNGMPSGALYLYWQDGFHRFFGPTFYLGDVGIFGSIYRLGFFAIPFYLFVGLWTLKMIRRMKRGVYKDFVVLIFGFLLITLPAGAAFEYHGFYVGIAYLLGIINRSDRRTVATGH